MPGVLKYPMATNKVLLGGFYYKTTFPKSNLTTRLKIYRQNIEKYRPMYTGVNIRIK